MCAGSQGSVEGSHWVLGDQDGSLGVLLGELLILCVSVSSFLQWPKCNLSHRVLRSTRILAGNKKHNQNDCCAKSSEGLFTWTGQD